MPCCHDHDSSCIRRVPVFGRLTPDEASTVADAVVSRHYRKGETIFREGEQSDKLFIVNEGTVKVTKLSPHGKEQILRFLFPGDFFGQFALLQERKHYANAEALEATVVCSIGRRDFQPLLERSADLAYRFLLAVSERLAEAEDWIGTIALLETERRLAKLLVLLYERGGRQPLVRLPAPKKELAALLGTTPETVSRKLASFEGQGILRVKRSSFIVDAPDALRALAI